MKKLYRIFLLLIVLIFLSTYNPNKFDLISEKDKDNAFFKVQNIEILNNSLVKESEIKEKLKAIYKKNIFLIKRSDIEEPLKEIVFLKKAEIKKKYPDTIIVKIFETRPVAILIKNKVRYVLDTSSNLIFFEDDTKFDQLPGVLGEDAENNFIYFFDQLTNNNFPKISIKNFYYFQIGRWDLELVNNKIIKFPENNTEEAIKKSIELLNRKDFENYKTIDLRVDGKIIVE